MKDYIIEITFLYDESYDCLPIRLKVPTETTLAEVKNALCEAHEILDKNEDEKCLYENNGRNYESLLSYTCEKHGWKWDDLKEDLELQFE